MNKETTAAPLEASAGTLVLGEIEEHMAHQGMALPELAAVAGMRRETLQRRMDKPDSFALPELERVAGALGTSPWALFGVYE